MSFWDYFNPIDQTQWLASKMSSAFGSPDDAGTYANVRGPDGRPVQAPSTYGQLLSQQTGLASPVSVSDGTRQALLAQQGGLAGQFADQAQRGYAAYGQQGQSALDGLRAQMQGQNSVSAEQLRQGLQQQLAQQRSFAAGGPPGSAAGRARTAAIQMGRASTAAAGQQAMAGIAERNQVTNQYGQLIGQLRGQDLSAATQSRQNALGGYGAGNTGAPQPSWIQQYGPAIAGGIAAASDRRLKTDVQPGDAQANSAIAALQPYAYRYKDPQAYGTGPQIGTTTQDLTRAGLQQAVIKTPAGEMVDAGKLSGANTAMIAALGQRVTELEGQKSPAAQRADPQGEAAQRALDGRRARLQDNDLYAAGAYPSKAPPDLGAIQAQQVLDRRRAMLAEIARQSQLAEAR